VEMYLFSHFNVPISVDSTSTYCILNASDGYIIEQLVNSGYGRNIGVDLSLTRYFSGYWYFTAASSLFNSTYKAWDNIWRNTRYNAQHVSSISVGKEFEKNYTAKKRIIGLNLRIVYQGGYRTTPIDTAATAIHGQRMYHESLAFSERLPNYFRSDFKIYFKHKDTKIQLQSIWSYLIENNNFNLSLSAFVV